jgi:diguanylate cyclase (GGDEF)-like protein
LGTFFTSYAIIFWLYSIIVNSEQKKRDALLYQLEHDELTGLPNRSYLYSHIDQWMKDETTSFDMLFIDLDNFKNINDRFGHQYGDTILKDVAKRLRRYFKTIDVVIRQGGDEFIVLMHCEDEERKEQMLEGLIKEIAKPYTVEAMKFNIGASVGSAQFPKDATSLESLMSLADIAMYEAKKHKNSYVIFSSELHSSYIRKADIEHELRQAIERDELWMVYQPQLERDTKLHGVEALVRWENKKLGFVTPDQFIGVAEMVGLMPKLGHFIIEKSLKELKELQEKTGKTFRLSLNISVRQLMEVDFLKKFVAQIEMHKFDTSLITLEITESLFIEDLEYVLPLLKSIRDKGIEISLDDFGTGYSSLSMLRELPIDELKIDKKFVDEILNVKEDRAMVESIINLGHNLSIATVAEGTESKEQVAMLEKFGCDLFQGYYFSRPLKAEDLEKFIKEMES